MTVAAASRSASTAGAMCRVWNAPATSSGRSRARAGGSAANAASCGRVPAATIWPAPLTFAGVSPCASMAAEDARPRRRRARRSSRSARPRRPAPWPGRGPGPAASRRRPGAPRRWRRRPARPRCARPRRRTGRSWPGRRPAPRPRRGGGDQQRLGDRGIADLVGAGGRPAADQVDAGQVGPGGRAGRRSRAAPATGRGTRGLRALAGCGDQEHLLSLHCRSPPYQWRRPVRSFLAGSCRESYRLVRLCASRPSTTATQRLKPSRPSAGASPVSSLARRSR